METQNEQMGMNIDNRIEDSIYKPLKRLIVNVNGIITLEVLLRTEGRNFNSGWVVMNTLNESDVAPIVKALKLDKFESSDPNHLAYYC